MSASRSASGSTSGAIGLARSSSRSDAEVGRQGLHGFGAHRSPRLLRRRFTAAAKSSRASRRRLYTVPSGIPSAAAVSGALAPSMSAHHEHRAAVEVERVERGEHEAPVARGVEGVLAARGVVGGVDFVEDRALAPRAAQMVADDAVREAEEPRPHGRARS